MNIRTWLTKHTEDRRGFTLLFAVLVSTLVVAIGATVVSIAVRQTVLSGTSRESQYAFYAANTVLECAFYWDVIGKAGGDGAVFPASGQTALSDPSGVTCVNGNIVTGTGFTTTFANRAWKNDVAGEKTIYIELKDITDDPNLPEYTYCAEAKISKTGPDSNGLITTTIEAKGYNTCDLDSPRAVERGLLQSYQS
jgi:hypothetical protein